MTDIRTFKVKTRDGTVLIVQEIKAGIIFGSPHYELMDGRVINVRADGSFEVFDTGQKLTVVS